MSFAGTYSSGMVSGRSALGSLRARRTSLALAATAAVVACVSGLSWAMPDDPGSPPPAPPPKDCPADLNGDGFVSGYDLGYLLSEWGDPAPALGGDINQDGVINGMDIGILLGAWGDCPGD